MKARKAEEKARTGRERTRKTMESQKPGNEANDGPSVEASCNGVEQISEPASKKPRRQVHLINSGSLDIDENTCCMSFGSYDDDVIEQSGRDWINCACGRWLHEECAEDHGVDDNGKDRFCSYCLDLME